MTGSNTARRGPLIALGALAVVLLATTVWTGAQLVGQVAHAASASIPSKTTSPTPTVPALPATVGGLPIRTDSTVDVGPWMASPWNEKKWTMYAPVSSDSDQAIVVAFDVTIYDAEERVLERTSARVGLLPGIAAMAEAYVRVDDPSQAASIRVEQISLQTMPNPYSGTIRFDELGVDGDTGRVVATLDSTLNPAPDRPTVFYTGYVDGEPIGVCDSFPELRYGDPESDGCYLQLASTEPLEPVSDNLIDVPKGTQIKAFVSFELD